MQSCRVSFSWALGTTLMFAASSVTFMLSQLPAVYDPEPAFSRPFMIVEQIAVIVAFADIVMQVLAAKSWLSLFTNFWFVLGVLTNIPFVAYAVRPRCSLRFHPFFRWTPSVSFRGSVTSPRF